MLFGTPRLLSNDRSNFSFVFCISLTRFCRRVALAGIDNLSAFLSFELACMYLLDSGFY